MDATHISTTIAAIIADYLGVRPKQIVIGARLSEDLGLDTLDLANIACSIEAQLGASIPDETIETAQSVAGLSAAVAQLLADDERAV